MCDEPLVLTVEETAELLRISRGSAYEAVRTGVIPSISIGRRILIPRQLLLDAITQQGQTEREDEWHEYEHMNRPTGGITNSTLGIREPSTHSKTTSSLMVR